MYLIKNFLKFIDFFNILIIKNHIKNNNWIMFKNYLQDYQLDLMLF